MREEYKRLIGEVDKTLSMLREGWMSALDHERAKWRERLDAMLDERLRLMKLRDSAPSPIAA